MNGFTVDSIFKDPKVKHSLTLFDYKNIHSIKIFNKNGKPYLKCYGSDIERPAKPEEIVRQLFIKKLMDEYGNTLDFLIPYRCFLRQFPSLWIPSFNSSSFG